jgi:hypothetical protein
MDITRYSALISIYLLFNIASNASNGSPLNNPIEQTRYSFARTNPLCFNFREPITTKAEPGSIKKEQTARKGKLYFFWGYNISSYTKSSIHFSGPGYDFTIMDLKAKDRPTPLDLSVYCRITKFTIPQYNFRIGYYFSDRYSISAGIDHMKYVVVGDQLSSISGYISPEISSKYQGNYSRTPIKLSTDLLMFEHTDGLNFASIDLERTQTLWGSKNGKNSCNLMGGIGAGPVIPRTDVRLLGLGLNNKFHIAGYGTAGKITLKLILLKYVFVDATLKGGWINLPDVITTGSDLDRADHQLGFFEKYIVGGFIFPIR